MTKDEYEDFVLRYKGCGACFPMYHTLSRFEKMWFTAIQKDVTKLEKENAELKKTYRKQRNKRIDELQKENAELRAIAENQQSSNMSRYFENKKLKEGLAVGSTLNKGLNSMNKALEEERDKYRNMVFDKDEQLTKAKEIIQHFVNECKMCIAYPEAYKMWYQEIAEAEQFLSETEK